MGNQFTLEPMAQATILCNESTIHRNPKEKQKKTMAMMHQSYKALKINVYYLDDRFEE